MDERLGAAMNSLLGVLQNGDFETVARAVFISHSKKPSAKWSLGNRIIMLLNDTEDARGFQQWKKASRHVRRGAKAFYIFGPVLKKYTDEDGEEVKKLVGFKTIPVFRYEDTEGEPLEGDDFDLEIPAKFDGIIKELGLSVEPVGFTGRGYGYYSSMRNHIRLATPEIEVFLHELCHAVDDKVHGGLKGGQHADQETVAEFGAAVLARLFGYEIPLGNTQRYLEHYGTLGTVAKFFKRIENVVSFVQERVTA